MSLPTAAAALALAAPPFCSPSPTRACLPLSRVSSAATAPADAVDARVRAHGVDGVKGVSVPPREGFLGCNGVRAGSSRKTTGKVRGGTCDIGNVEYAGGGLVAEESLGGAAGVVGELLPLPRVSRKVQLGLGAQDVHVI
eukprot:92808-Hanusia_phi.AAC.6